MISEMISFLETAPYDMADNEAEAEEIYEDVATMASTLHTSFYGRPGFDDALLDLALRDGHHGRIAQHLINTY